MNLVFFPAGNLCVHAQIPDFKGIPSEVDFSPHERPWDGSGFNYTETAHTYNYDEFLQDYGGFIVLAGSCKDRIIPLVLGTVGLKVSLLKMFLDPLHEKSPGEPFNHTLSARNMVEFAGKGLKKTTEVGR